MNAIHVTHAQAWMLLSGAIVLEAAGTTSMRLSEGFTRITPAVFMLFFMGPHTASRVATP